MVQKQDGRPYARVGRDPRTTFTPAGRRKAKRSSRLQVESYLTKPVDLEKFRNVVRDLSRFWHADMILPTA